MATLARKLIDGFAGGQAAGGGAAYRYWRISITALNNSGTQVGLEEIELRGYVGGADLTTSSTPVTESSYLDNGEFGAYPALCTTDGVIDNPYSVWYTVAAVPFPHWARYDLATAKIVAQVAIKPYPSAGNCPRDFTIQGSADGTNFTNVKTFSGVAAWTGWKTFDL